MKSCVNYYKLLLVFELLETHKSSGIVNLLTTPEFLFKYL